MSPKRYKKHEHMISVLAEVRQANARMKQQQRKQAISSVFRNLFSKIKQFA